MPQYPGLGLNLRHYPQQPNGFYPMGMNGDSWGATSDILPVREVAMMVIMDSLTDKIDWHRKVFDDDIVDKWRKEALEYPDELLWREATGGKGKSGWGDPMIDIKPLTNIISTEAFDYCVQELREKARYYENSGLIPTLDACATVVKSDIIISSELQNELCAAFKKLEEDQSASPDWHPSSGDMVQDLLHPSMYPLVYGQSKGFQEEVVGVGDAIAKWAGKGEVIEKEEYKNPGDYWSGVLRSGAVPPKFWSDTYQWLPSNVAFQDDGSVRFVSYINNLHPEKYHNIYSTIEKLVERVLPAWDQCLAVGGEYKEEKGVGRTHSRFSKPDDPDDGNEENWDPSNPEAVANVEVNFEEDDQFDHLDEDEADRKWHILRKPIHNHLQPNPFKDDTPVYIPEANSRLSRKFKDSGLQIIVKMASIELTPEKPDFPAGSWHVEGQMNERICATALYYLDSENISPSKLSFRMQTDSGLHDDVNVGQDAYSWMEQVYGTDLSTSSACLQNYGSVETRQGRLLAFPNVFQHRVSPFHLTDPTKPGHRRFIALWLVDPHARIISTANIPPQQQDWWTESVFSSSDDARADLFSKFPAELAQLLRENGVATGSKEMERSKLPPEVYEILREHFNEEGNKLLMTKAEAKVHREKLMEVRGAFRQDTDNHWHQQSYAFCEH